MGKKDDHPGNLGEQVPKIECRANRWRGDWGNGAGKMHQEAESFANSGDGIPHSLQEYLHAKHQHSTLRCNVHPAAVTVHGMGGVGVHPPPHTLLRRCRAVPVHVLWGEERVRDVR